MRILRRLVVLWRHCRARAAVTANLRRTTGLEDVTWHDRGAGDGLDR